MLEKSKGIVIVVYGHPYYGRMAFNLCCSIKAVEDFPVAVVHGGAAISHLSQHQLDVFDEIILLPSHAGEGFSPKLYINEITPYDQTLFLDADMLWVPYRRPSELFEELQGADYTAITEGWCDIETLDCTNANPAYYFWAEVKEIKETYKLKEGKLYQWRSEVMYFEKNSTTEKFFKKAQAIHAKPKLKTIRRFGPHIPDELSINIAAALTGITPHREKWTPAYWYSIADQRLPTIPELREWYLVSFGGKNAMGSLKKLYDSIASVALKKLGRQHIFSLHPKSSYLPERAKI